MGRQVRFFSLPFDEKQLIHFVLSQSNTFLIQVYLDNDEVVSLDESQVFNPQNESIREFFISNSRFTISKTDIIDGRKRQFDEITGTLIDSGKKYSYVSSNAPVIQLMRSFIRDSDGKLVQGRIWCDFYRLVGDRFEYKGDEFKEFYLEIATWIKRRFKKIKGIDGYFGKDALDWYQQGGVLFP